MEKRKDIVTDAEIKWDEFTSPEIERQLDLVLKVLTKRLEENQAALRRLASMGVGQVPVDPNKPRRGRRPKSHIVDADDMEFIEDDDGLNGAGDAR